MNIPESRKIEKERLLKLKSQLEKKCNFVDCGVVSCKMPIKTVVQMTDEEQLLEKIEENFNQNIEQSTDNKVLESSDLILTFYLFFSKAKERYYRSQKWKDTVLVNVHPLNSNHDKTSYSLVPVSFNKMLKLLKKKGYQIDFDSYDELVNAFAQDLPMYVRVTKTHEKGYQKTKKSITKNSQ